MDGWRDLSPGLRELHRAAHSKPPRPSTLAFEDSLAVFLTGSLPKRDTSAMYEFILCVKRLNIKLPKDIYKMIYERLRLVALDEVLIYCSRPDSEPVVLASYYDFVILRTETDGILCFNDLQYPLVANFSYFLFTGALRLLSVTIECDRFSLEYHSFIDRDSFLCCAIYSISGGLNSNLNEHSLIYLNDSILRANDTLTRLPKEKFKAALEVCIRYGLVSLDDPLGRQPISWVDHHGHPIAKSTSGHSSQGAI
jgi:hypothetical protein